MGRIFSIFTTFTCNAKWLEIQRFVDKQGLKAKERPDIVRRVFKMKLDQFVRYAKKEKVFGRVKSCRHIAFN